MRLSAETVGALLPDVLVLLGSSRPYVRKKAALCSTFFLLKQIRAQRTHGLQAGRLGEGLHSAKPGDAVTLSDEDSEVAPLLQRLQQQLMAEQDVAVLSCLTTALLQVAAVEPRPFRSLAPPLFHLLCTSSSNWFTLKLLKLFSLLCDAEPRLPAKLLQPLLQILEKTKAKSVEVEAVRLALFHAPLEEALEEALFLKAKNASHEAAASQAASALTSDLREGSGNPDAASSAEGEPREARLLKFVLQRLQGLLTAADRNLRFVALDVLLQTFQRRRSFAKRLWKLLTGFQMQLLQVREPKAFLLACVFYLSIYVSLHLCISLSVSLSGARRPCSLRQTQQLHPSLPWGEAVGGGGWFLRGRRPKSRTLRSVAWQWRCWPPPQSLRRLPSSASASCKPPRRPNKTRRTWEEAQRPRPPPRDRGCRQARPRVLPRGLRGFTEETFCYPFCAWLESPSLRTQPTNNARLSRAGRRRSPSKHRSSQASGRVCVLRTAQRRL